MSDTEKTIHAVKILACMFVGTLCILWGAAAGMTDGSLTSGRAVRMYILAIIAFAIALRIACRQRPRRTKSDVVVTEEVYHEPPVMTYKGQEVDYFGGPHPSVPLSATD